MRLLVLKYLSVLKIAKKTLSDVNAGSFSIPNNATVRALNGQSDSCSVFLERLEFHSLTIGHRPSVAARVCS
jgi:hypothetical protein